MKSSLMTYANRLFCKQAISTWRDPEVALAVVGVERTGSMSVFGCGWQWVRQFVQPRLELAYTALSCGNLFWRKAWQQSLQIYLRFGFSLLRGDLIPHVRFH